MKFRKVLCYNVVIMMFGNTCGFATENETATKALNNLITTTADSLVQNNQNVNQSTEQTPTDSGTTALPVFDDVSGNTTTPLNTQPTSVSQTIPQQSAPTFQTQQQNQPNVFQSQTVQPIPQTSQNHQVKKRVGFISKNGVALIAPDDMQFPNEMQDGEVYYFSRDIEALKAKIAQGTQIFPQQQVIPQQMATQQVVSQQIVPQQQGITQSQQAFPQQNIATTQIFPQQTQNNAEDCKDCHVWLKTAL